MRTVGSTLGELLRMATGPAGKPPREPQKEPPKVSQAYLTGKSSRPREETVSLPLGKIAAGIAAVVVIGVAWTAWSRIAKTDAALQEWAAMPLVKGSIADDVASSLRVKLLAAGAVPLDVEASVPESSGNEPQTIPVSARYRITIFGIPFERSHAASLQGAGLIPGSYRGDGTPKAHAVGAQKLQKVLSTAQCPEGTTQMGAPPPRGTETWCEKPGPKGKPVRHGPFFAWHPSGSPLEEGTYKEGKRDGRWTRFNDAGQREAEAFYRDDVQHGRFRRWDASGTQVMDVEYRDGVPVTR